MNMTIIAKKGKRTFTKLAMKEAETAIQLLGEVGKYKNVLKRSAFEIRASIVFPEVIQRMISTCLTTKDRTLTPMSAVAGAISDIVAERIESKGATKVIVENGGDIALKLHGDETAKIGIIPKIGGTVYTHVIHINAESKIRGVSTSGLGGLGFTTGVASAAVALSTNAALADACGTIIGNSTTVNSKKVSYKLAEELDPNTDLKGTEVTFKVKQLTSMEAHTAVDNGLRKAEELMKSGVVEGAIIFVQGKRGMIPKSVARPLS